MNTNVNHNEKMILGLDIGTNSIGWVLMAEEAGRPTGFVDLGVRIFNKGVTDGNNPIPKNRERRNKRLARRVIQRRARRKRRMEAYLIKLGLLPAELATTENREKLLNSLGDPYELRARGLDHKLKPFEVGRVLLHLVQRRGFLSNRKSALGDLADDPDVLAVLDEQTDLKVSENEKTEQQKEERQFKQEIANLREAIENSGYRTLGEYLYKSEELVAKRNRVRNGGNLRTDRAMYMDELDQIWGVQEEFHSALDQSVRDQIDEIIFYQRPIQLKSDRVGKCSLEIRNRRCAKARLEYQEFRYLQDVNNLDYIDPLRDQEMELDQEQVRKLQPLSDQYKNVSYKKIRKHLGFCESYKFRLEAVESKRGLTGNLTALSIAKVLPAWSEYDRDTKLRLTEDLLTIKKKSALKKRLMDHWGFTKDEAISLCLLEFEEGYANLSLKAINKLLPCMREGKKYHDARVAAGYGYEKKQSDSLDRLPSPPEIRNPIVSRALNEVRKLVNAIIKTYGKPGVIRVEMARDLEMNTKKYDRYMRQQRKNERENREAEESWSEVSKAYPHLKLRKYPSIDDKIKYRLWKDQKELCAYSCMVINPVQLFSGEVEVDHIIPKSLSVVDSYMNKVVCFSKENRLKGSRTPIDAFEGDSVKWDEITSALEMWDKSLYGKKTRFRTRGKDVTEGFDSSQLIDTRYIAREALTYFEQLGCDVTTTKGVMTSWLRRQWGLNSLISDDDKKDRSDHRHHIIDAAITACIDRSFYQSLVNKAKRIEKSTSKTIKDLRADEPWSDFRADLDKLLEGVIVSHQTSTKIKGALHEETGIGYKRDIGAVYRKNVAPDLKNIDSIYNDDLKRILAGHLEKHGSDPKVAFSPDNPVFHKDGKTPIKRVRVRQSQTTLEEMESNKFIIKAKDGKPLRYHSYGNIHSVDVFYGERDNTYLSKFHTVEEARRKALRNHRKYSSEDQKPIFTLHKNDAVKLLVNGEKKLFRVQKIGFTDRKVTFMLNNKAKADHKADSVTIVMNDNNIKKYDIEKVSINILGRIPE